MWEGKKEKKNESLDEKAVPDHCSKFRVSATSEEKSLFHNILVTSEAISAGPAAGCALQALLLDVLCSWFP